MNLTDFPGEILTNIFLYLDIRSICRLFRSHSCFRSFYAEEYLWRQLCHRDLQQSVISGTYRDYYYQHIPIFQYLWCTGRVIQMSLRGHINRDSILLPRDPVFYDITIPKACSARIYIPVIFGGSWNSTTIRIRYLFPKFISKFQIDQFIQKLHPDGQLIIDRIAQERGGCAISSVRLSLQINEWYHRRVELGRYEPCEPIAVDYQ